MNLEEITWNRHQRTKITQVTLSEGYNLFAVLLTGLQSGALQYYPLTKSLGPLAVMLHSRISTVVHAEAVCAQKIHLIDYFFNPQFTI